MSKRLKKILISLLLIVVSLGALRLYINSVLKEVIYEQVKSFSKNNYKLHIDKINIGLLAINATIEGFDLKHIPNAKDSLIPYGNIKAKAIRLRSLNLAKLIFSRSLKLGSFELIDPKIDIYYNSENQDTAQSKEAVDLFTIEIRKLQLKNVEINLFDAGNSSTALKAKDLVYDIKKFKLEITEILIDQIKPDASYLHFVLNEGNVKGFDLNQLFNERTFNYSEISFDKIDLDISKKNIQRDSTNKLEKVKSISQNKFFKSIKPLNIRELRFSSTNGHKKVEFKGKKLNYSNTNFTIKSFELDLTQKIKIHMVSKQLAIKGMDADSINEGYQIEVDRIELEKPEIKLVLQNNIQDKDTSSSILSLFSIKKVNSLDIKKGDIQMSHKEKPNMKAMAKNIDLSAKNLMPGNGNLYFDNATFKAANLFFNMPDNKYNIKIGSISYGQAKGKADVSNFKLTPNHTKENFAKLMAKQVARIDLGIKTVELQNFNILDVINRQTFICQKILIEKMNAEFYKDKNIPLLASDIKKFPQEIIREVNFGLNINTIEIKNSVITSEVLSSDSKKPGIMDVDMVNMVVKGIDNTNSTSNMMQVNFNGRLAGTGAITATATLPLNDPQCNHSAYIEIGKMPFSKLNTFINEVAHFTITSGELDKARININGNKTEVNCKLELHYHDLVMKILADKSTTTNTNKLMLANRLANSVIINNNPIKGEPVRISETKVPVEKNKFIINNWIAATLNSMINTAAPKAVKFIKRNKKTESKEAE